MQFSTYHEMLYNKSDIASARWLFWKYEITEPDGDDEFYSRPNSEGELDEGIELDDFAEYHAEMLAAQLAAIRNSGPGPCDSCQLTNPSRELWEDIWPLAWFWFHMNGSPPNGPFAEMEAGGRPEAHSGADFIYVALKGINREFSDLEFREQFEKALEVLEAREPPRDKQPLYFLNGKGEMVDK